MPGVKSRSHVAPAQGIITHSYSVGVKVSIACNMNVKVYATEDSVCEVSDGLERSEAINNCRCHEDHLDHELVAFSDYAFGMTSSNRNELAQAPVFSECTDVQIDHDGSHSSFLHSRRPIG